LSPASAIVREFLVDFLGSLVPGFFFVSLAAPLVLALCLTYWNAMAAIAGVPADYGSTLEVIRTFRIEVVCTLLVLAYVLGTIFHHRDPKEPDQESAEYILRRLTEPSEVHRLVIQPEEWPPASGLPPRGKPVFSPEEAHRLATGEGAQYPYSHLKEYLISRGLYELAELVKWEWAPAVTPAEKEARTAKDLRSKMFINVLKIRLQYEAPEKCGIIIRNEAHIRMMSSVWFACKALQRLSGAVTAIAALVLLAVTWKAGPPRLPSFWSIPALAALVWLFGKLVQLPIRKFIHYQRIREIVFVLETAWFAAKSRGRESVLRCLPGDRQNLPSTKRADSANA